MSGHLQLIVKLQTITVLTGVLLAQGCVSNVLLNSATDPGDFAVLRSVGDTGFRWGRTASNRGPTPFVIRVDGRKAESFTSVTLTAGVHDLQIDCVLPSSALAGAPVPFSRYSSGEGVIFGTAVGGARAIIDLHVALERGRTYELTCDVIGPLRAGAQIKAASGI